MFRSARIKLTGWYLLIIMLISVVFSMGIYSIMSRELERGFRRVEMRFRAEESNLPFPADQPPKRREEISSRFSFVEDLEAAKKRIVLGLLAVNGIILGVSAAAGHFLAGKTLRPIEKVMNEQKRFVTDASHEFRTPLTSLKTSMEVSLRDKKLSLLKAKKVIKSNLEDIDGLQSLSNSLLSLANLQNNGRNLIFEKIDITQAIRDARRKILPLAKEKNIKIKMEVKKQNIQANKESLEEMMLIFLDNAVKYTPERGKITISTKTDKSHLNLKIADTGIGITSKDIPHVFDRFYRADQSRSKNNTPGFGLGLSLAKKIIEMYRGSVEVMSRIGKGTTFIVELPLKHS